MAGDHLGRMDISLQGVIERDSIVFDNALQRHIPIVMVLSGGYSQQSALVISKSIENLLSTYMVELNLNAESFSKSSKMHQSLSNKD